MFSPLSEKGYPPMAYALIRPFTNLVDVEYYYEKAWFVDMLEVPLLMLIYIAIIAAIVTTYYSLIKNHTEGGRLAKSLTALTMMLSMPMVVTVERGNIIILAALASFIFIFNYNNENAVVKEFSLISLAFAFSLKLYPAILGCLLLYDKKYKEAVRTAIYGLLCLFVPFIFLEGGFANIPYMIRNLGLLKDSYSVTGGISLESILCYIRLNIYNGASRYIVCVILLLYSFFLERKWEKITALTLIMIFAINPSHSYGLMYFIPMFIMFLNEKEYRRLDWLVFIGLIDIFILFNNTIPLINKLFGYIDLLDYKVGILLIFIHIMIRGTKDTAVNLIELASKKRPDLLKSKAYLLLTGKIKINFRKPSDKEKKIRLGILIGILVLVVTFSAVIKINSDIPKEYARHKALRYYEEGDYEHALAIFERLTDYKDSEEYAEKCLELLPPEKR